jgi:4-hydroxybenzoate polyprenyltransferase
MANPIYPLVMTVPPRQEDSGAFSFPADTALPGWLGSLPATWRPYAMLARLDRPVGIWLLYLPCLIGLLFQRLSSGPQLVDLGWAALFFIGAVVMRGAGCTWNDITDRGIDAKVARTALRPIPSGAITVPQAYKFLFAQLAIGFAVWLLLPADAKITALLALPLVAVGAATASVITGPVYLLYFGLGLWTIAFDTIYALQDREDDALIGVRSTARLFGKRAVLFSFCFHMGAAALIALAAAFNDAGRIGALTALAFLMHGLWQAMILKTRGEAAALGVFKSNVWAGALVAAGFLIAAIASGRAPQSTILEPVSAPSEQASSKALPFGLEVLRERPPKPEVRFARDIRRAMELRGLDPDDPENFPER